MNFFDTADTYGLGQSEITLGKALGRQRQDVIIASKFGVRIENGKTFYDNTPQWIETALEGSLKRLEPIISTYIRYIIEIEKHHWQML